jgi:hypothetical protein
MPCKVEYVDDRSKVEPSFVLESHHLWFEYTELLPQMLEYLPSPLNETDYSDLVKYIIENKNLIYDYADTLMVSMPKPRTSHFEADIETIRGRFNQYF